MTKLCTSRYQTVWRRDLASEGLVAVRITVGDPRFIPGVKSWPRISELAPYGGLFKIDDKAEFTLAFYERLDGFGAERIMGKIRAISEAHEGRGLVMCCYEDLTKPGEWCHRQVVAQFIEERVGIHVPELGPLPGV